MKKSLAIIATLTLMGINAQAQTDRGSNNTPPTKEQPAKSENVNPDANLDAPVPASLATPEQLAKKQQQTDAKPAAGADQKPAYKKPSSAPDQSSKEKKLTKSPDQKPSTKNPSAAPDQKPAAKKSTTSQKESK